MLRIWALGGDGARLFGDGRELTLSRRHSEIVVLLAAQPPGLSTEQLALELFGEAGKPVGVRAEVSGSAACWGLSSTPTLTG